MSVLRRFETLPPVIRHLIPALACIALSACTILPKVEDKPVSHAIAAPQHGPASTTSRRINRQLAKDQSAFLLLEEAKEGLDWRLALIDSATSSIDIQLYLWHQGASSSLIFFRALQAAERGVRVRILVDDFLLNSNEPALAALCREHPRFDVRIFNPGRVRNNSFGALAEWASNFRSLNRRMHNKTFTVDRSLSIVGGRNIGDHYYGMDRNYNFIDLDVLASGPVVDDISDGFDAFWNSSHTFPGTHLSSKRMDSAVQTYQTSLRTSMEEDFAEELRNYPLDRQDWSRMLGKLPAGMHFGKAEFIQDHPEVHEDNRQLVRTLEEVQARKQGEVTVVSPYLLPSDASIENIKNAEANGVDIRILTASLEANNQPLVDGHYRKIRARLVDNGAEVHEFRPDPNPQVRADADVPPVVAKRITLHAKTIVVDNRRSFIGSLNLDPRALDINTESGLLIDSKPLARELNEWLEELCSSDNSWAISRDANGMVQWQSRDTTRTTEPPAKWSRKLMSRISGLLPIRDQL